MCKGWMEACSVVASYAESVLLWLHTLCRARLCCRQGVRLGANVPALRRAPCQRHESLTVILLAWWTERRKGEAFFFLSAICLLFLSFSFFVYVCVCVNKKRCFMAWRGTVGRDKHCGHHQRGIQRWHASPTAARNMPGHICTHTDVHLQPATSFEKAKMHTHKHKHWSIRLN